MPLLPPLEDEVEELARDNASMCDDWEDGYNKAKEKFKYTEEDIKLAFEAGHKKGFSGYPNTENWKELSFKEWLEKFTKPKYPVAFECKMIDKGEEDWIGDDITGEPFWNQKLEPKTITNSQGLTQLVGKYIVGKYIY